MLKQDWPEELSSLKSAADKKKSDLMEKYPCIQLTSLFKGYENRLSKISFNEKIIQFLGYTTDSFASNILREGIPRYGLILRDCLLRDLQDYSIR